MDEEEMRRWIEMERIRKEFEKRQAAALINHLAAQRSGPAISPPLCGIKQAALGGGNALSPYYVNPSLAGMTPAPAVEQPISVKELLARIRAGCD